MAAGRLGAGLRKECMEKPRREFLKALAAGALGGAFGWGPAFPASTMAAGGTDEALAPWGSYPLEKEVAAFRERQLTASLRPTGLDRRQYLRLVEGVTRYFAAHQDARGAIVDPYERRERQYSTPAFACAAAVLAGAGRGRDLLPACMKAMDAATADLAAGRTADRHPDFYTILLMYALQALRRQAPARRVAAWRQELRGVVPSRIYRQQPDAASTNNWNLVAASGEWLRHRAGLTDDTRWIEASLARHMDAFTAHGMYRDPNDPLAYDHFARYHVELMLEHEYNGRHAAALRALTERGAWTSLFMQSPHGELPCGGRSAHHQWNEAEQAVTYELWAHRLSRRGDRAGAGAFKRAARLALRSVGRWVRPSGELWVVKNRFDPERRHGYENYSFHSQYNLLAAAMLAVAYLHADERVPERPCPAEVGGFVFALQPAFHKVFANAGGMYLEMDTGADPKYNPTGLLRLHHPGVDPQLSLSDGATRQAAYRLPQRPGRSLAIGPAWRDREGAWHALADYTSAEVRPPSVQMKRATPGGVEFDVEYTGGLRGGAKAVRQSYSVRPDGVEVADAVSGDVAAVRQYFPLLVTDGRDETRIEVAARRASASYPGRGTIAYVAQGEGPPLSRLGAAEPVRNGALDAAYVEGHGPTMHYSMLPRRG